MKLKPQIYAEALVESAKEKKDLKKISANLWYRLQKNKQYRDLGKIISGLDAEYARSQNLVLAHVYSEKELTDTEIKDIKAKIEKKIGQKVLVINAIRKTWGGVVVEIDDKIIDLTTKGKIEQLQKKLSS